jgi:hypothetical protein
VRSNIVKLRRKTRLNSLIDEVTRIPSDAVPLTTSSKKRVEALGRNIPINWLLFFTSRNWHAIHIWRVTRSKTMTVELMDELKELIADWASFSGEV